ncbi:EKC/KEOPS complex [Aphelenchoides avenae]|nr:EKC/KEOPS complex [Aphelenchus avenae]
METKNFEVVADDSGSDTEQQMQPTGGKHKAQVQVVFDGEEMALLAYRVLNVDREPDRSTATRKLSVSGQHLIAEFACEDMKYLQKSVQNFFDMCSLTMQTMTTFG